MSKNVIFVLNIVIAGLMNRNNISSSVKTPTVAEKKWPLFLKLSI